MPRVFVDFAAGIIAADLLSSGGDSALHLASTLVL